jgi:hypothetical protein
MKKLHKLFLPAVFIFSINTLAQTSTGKLSLTKGLKLQIDNSVKSVITQEMMGQSMEIKIDANTTHQVEVKDKKDSSYLVTSTFTKLKTSGSAMGQELNFDSDKKEDMESETGKAMKDRLNVPKDIEINVLAKVINAPKTVTKKDEPASGGGMMDMMKNIMGGENDESNGADQAFEILPAGKKIGDNWSDSTITSEVKTYRQYTLKQINGNIATISISGKQLVNKQMEQQGMQITVTSDGKLSGEGTVDMTTGILQKKTTSLDSTGSAEVMGQSIPVTTKTTSVLTVKNL